MVVSELRGEKIDIVPYNDEPARFVAKALSPARVREVLVDDDIRQATVIVPDDQLSLAIGREGQNARLAARLTGWRIDIRSESEFAGEPQDDSYDEPDTGGRCGAVMTTGRRCPNATLPGSRYCGLPSHQALARFGAGSLLLVQGLTDDEVAVLASPESDEAQVAELVAKGEAHAAQAAAAAEQAQAEADAAADALEADAEAGADTGADGDGTDPDASDTGEDAGEPEA